VNSAKDRVYLFDIVFRSASLNVEHLGFDIRQVLVGFDYEFGNRFCVIEGHVVHTLAIWRTETSLRRFGAH